jgi:hypothetical protein
MLLLFRIAIDVVGLERDVVIEIGVLVGVVLVERADAKAAHRVAILGTSDGVGHGETRAHALLGALVGAIELAATLGGGTEVVGIGVRIETDTATIVLGEKLGHRDGARRKLKLGNDTVGIVGVGDSGNDTTTRLSGANTFAVAPTHGLQERNANAVTRRLKQFVGNKGRGLTHRSSISSSISSNMSS